MSVARNALWLAACRLAADAAGVALFAAIARALGPAGAGAYSYAYVIASLAAIFASSGLEEYGVREYARLPPAQRRTLWANLLAVQAVLIVAAAAALGLYALLPDGGAAVVAILSFFLVGSGVARTLFVPSLAAQAMAGPAMAELGCRLAATAGALLVLATPPSSPLALVLAGFPPSAAALVALAALSARRHAAGLEGAGGASWRGVRATLCASAPFAGAELLWQFYVRADMLLIAHYVGAEGVGLYAAGVKFVEVGLIPLALLGQAAYPLLSRAADVDPPLFRRAARDLVATVLFLSGYLAVGLACVVPLVAVPLLGGRFAPIVPILPWFAALALLKALGTACVRLLYATRRQAACLRGLAVGTAANVLLNLVLIPAFGVTGAVAAVTASAALTGLAYGLELRHHLPHLLGRREIARAAAGLTAAFAATLAAVAGAAWLLADAGPWLAAAVACVAYPAAALAVGLVPDPRRAPLFGGTPAVAAAPR